MTDPLEKALGGPAHAALLDWASQQRRTVRLTNPPWMAHGYTGAMLAAVVVTTPGQSDRQVIVKACPAGQYADETGAHQEAQAHSSRDFFQRHLVGQAYDPYPIPGGGRLMFQDIAGASLDLAPLSGVPDERLPAACRSVIDSIVRSWNPTLVRSVQTTVGDYLTREFTRTLSAGVSPESLATSLGLLGPGFRYLRDETPRGPVDTPNPLFMMSDEKLGAGMRIDAVVGLAHGDLHTENVLIPKAYGEYGIDEFRLVDLSSFEPGAPVTRDPVTLMMSVVAPTISELRSDEQEALLSFVLEPWKPPARLSALFAQTLETIHRTGNEAIKSMNLGDWRSQYLLSVIATALQFTAFTSIGDEGRWWFFRLAGRAGGEFLRHLGVYDPQDAVTIRRPVSWPPAVAALAAPTFDLDEAGYESLVTLLGNLPPDQLRHAYTEMATTSEPTTQPNWRDPRAVILAVDRDAEPWAGIDPLLVYAERLAHALGGGAGLRLHGWVTECGRLHYPEEHLRGLCAAVSRHFSDDIAVSPAGSMRESTSDSSSSRDLSTISSGNDLLPGGSTVLATSVSAPSSETAAAVPRPIRGGLPPKNPDFTGREALLARLELTLRASKSISVVPQALHGLGGVGKTQLATEFAYRHLDEYPVVWWMTAETPGQVRTSLAQLAQRLGTPVESDIRVTTALVLEALSTSGFPWLLVYDNVESPEILSDLVPSTGTGHVIITSRNTAAWSTRGEAIEVDVFERAESIQLLQRHGRSIAETDADRLADKLGDLPLALEQAAIWHATTGMPIAEYLELFDANVRDLMDEGKPVDYPHTIYAFLKLAVHRLRDEFPAAAELLELFAYLGPEPVSVTLLRAGRSGGLSEALTRALDRPIDLNRAIREVRRFGLARVDKGQRVQVHRLIQRVLREELITDRAQQSRRNVQRLLAAANPGYPDEQINWPVHNEIAPHVEAAQLVDADDDGARMVVVDQIRYFFVIGDYESSRHLGEMVVDKWRRAAAAGTLDRDDELTLIAQRHLANAYRLLGQTSQARQLDTDTFERLRDNPLFGEDHEHTLYTANNLGVDLRLEGQLIDALQVEKENAARHLEVRGEDDESTLRAQNNLAVSLRHLGRFTESRPMSEEILRRQRKEIGESDPRILLSITNLAWDNFGLGRYRQALEMMRTALPQFRDLLGPRHRDLLVATRTLTMALRKSGFYAEARDNARQNYRDHFTRFGPAHEHTLAAKSSYALALRRCASSPSEVNEARTMLREATDVYRDVFSDLHPLTLAARVNLAVALRAAGDRNEARLIDEGSLARLTSQLGDEHPYTLAAATNLAEDLRLAGQLQEASELSWSTYRLAVDSLGADHPDTLASAINAALNKIQSGEDSGQTLFDESIKMMSAVLGTDHPATLDAVRGQRSECDIEAPPC
ncbi:FxSxx-COOH system tetratricopeptide repeat protein [Actinoplanes sp. NPDC051411]|uniref:FxSxx-COOH system tetratricopeptide repeat protein n=1 Tax=Actinoplanes sp. NPDC051411 TaxID=3155522 RepID=UPI00341479F5